MAYYKLAYFSFEGADTIAIEGTFPSEAKQIVFTFGGKTFKTFFGEGMKRRIYIT